MPRISRGLIRSRAATTSAPSTPGSTSDRRSSPAARLDNCPSPGLISPSGSQITRPQPGETADMGNVKIPYLEQVKGRWYWHPGKAFRKAGFRTVALGATVIEAAPKAMELNLQARQHMLALMRAERDGKATQPQEPEGAGRARIKLAHRGLDMPPIPGTVGELIDRYLDGARVARLSPKTQADYRARLKRLKRVIIETSLHGKEAQLALRDIPVEMIRPKIADKIYGDLAVTGPTDAHAICRYARACWSWGIREDLAASNPWEKMGIESPPAREQSWTRGQIAAFIRECRKAGRHSIIVATMIGYYGGQRATDCRETPWSAELPDMLRIDQSKTKRSTAAVALVPLNKYPALRVALAGARRICGGAPHPDSPICRQEETSGYWKEYTFQREVRRLMTLAGLPKDLQFRDLRATATTELQDGGADTTMTQTHTGHKTQQMVRRYTRKRVKQAENAAEMRLAGRKKT